MIVFEWTKPGRSIEGLDRDDEWRISVQIIRLEDAVEEANVALNMFDHARANFRTLENLTAEASAKIAREVEAELFPDGIIPKEVPGENRMTEYERRRAQLDAEVRHRLWNSGFLPQGFLRTQRFIFAKAFIHALDLFGKFISDIAKNQSAPSSIKNVMDRYFKEIPDLKEVRNSIQHAEDRSKGMARKNKIDLKKIDGSKISVDGTALISLGLDGNRFGATMKDGHYGAVDITADTLEVMRYALLDVYSAFKWTGGEKLFPE